MYDKYTVGYNETLNDIADKFNTTKEELDFMDDFIEWLESRGETFFGLTYKLKEDKE